ncbi:MAG: hypothetical protein OXE73_02125 [Gammaproteobacteria bacterium]|nr:hypothetical protein [Gammaproteobacteria bacterium]
MTEHHDAIAVLEEYLDYLCDDAGVGHEAVTDQDIGAAVLPHFGSQLIAIRSVLERNQEAEDKVAAEIERIETEIRARGGSSWMESERISHLHSSTFLDAAHSMAAVGLIAPLIESLVDRAFRYLKRAVGDSYSLGSGHERWQLDDRWDKRFVWKRGRRSRDIAKGIVQLAEAIDLRKHLPADLEKTLSALFAYRDRMFHGGLEWPEKDVKDFANLIASKGWTNCFTSADSGGDPWIFYLSREFTDHCLDTVDEIINGVGARVRRVLRTRSNPRGSDL